jgi:alkyl sulfatase BDS1-like metallo-beta-lactamase superfamily hydrolase
MSRTTKTSGGLKTAGPDIIKEMPAEMLFDYLAVRLNGRPAGRRPSA